MIRLRSTKRADWPELRDRLITRLPRHFPATDVVVGDDATPHASWYEGPSVQTVWEIVNAPEDWQVEVLALGAHDLPSDPEPKTLYVGRTLSELAIAIGVVRFRASGARPFSSLREGHATRLAALVDVDDPARVAYPIVRSVAEELVATSDAAAPLGHAGDRLSEQLESLGYETLWNRAWVSVC